MNVLGLRFAANMSILYGHLPLLDRPAAAAADGFDAVECWWPFSSPAPADRETDAFAAALDDAGVRLVAMNFVEGDMRTGDRGLLSSPGRHGEFRAGIDTAVGFAARVGCRILNALYGNREPGADPARQDQLALGSLARAAAAADTIGAKVVLEAISPREAPDYPLGDADAAVTAADAVNAVTGLTNVGVLCDLYHHGRSGEDVPALLRRHAARIAHVQVADDPGRGRPGSGALDYPAYFDALQDIGYHGWIGLEYEPTRDPAVDYDWLPHLRPGR
ncbi:hydroxypyruvate isomerase family protein [Micromonospora narathiwatensis]|uniref:Hydroxypyruvate isomerase n=1 Tax=Micromonospora narathiwatensis TaxID=299146 RepID=A0A1A8ZAC4_9ACTN|nr:TIM barrel protein [Micromonospora narathiwatensis]SBT40780.1 hydroxypyruvate isomerase [Micromonospora narathiwatensis]